MTKPVWPDLCPTCREKYYKGFTVCSNAFHCCRDCTWADGRRTELCEVHTRLETMRARIKSGELRIEAASEDKMSKHWKQVQLLLKTVADCLEEPGMTDAFVTDESMLCDFLVSEEDCAVLSKKLGILVKADDYLWVIASRMCTKN